VPHRIGTSEFSRTLDRKEYDSKMTLKVPKVEGAGDERKLTLEEKSVGFKDYTSGLIRSQGLLEGMSYLHGDTDTATAPLLRNFSLGGCMLFSANNPMTQCLYGEETEPGWFHEGSLQYCIITRHILTRNFQESQSPSR